MCLVCIARTSRTARLEADLPAVDVATEAVLGLGNWSLERDQKPTKHGNDHELQLMMDTDRIT